MPITATCRTGQGLQPVNFATYPTVDGSFLICEGESVDSGSATPSSKFVNTNAGHAIGNRAARVECCGTGTTLLAVPLSEPRLQRAQRQAI